MSFAFTSPYLLPLLVSALISTSVAVYAWVRRASSPSAVGLTLLGLSTAEWALTYALEIAGADYQTKLFWGKLQYLGIAITPLFWLFFGFRLANLGHHLSLRRLFLLALLPVISIFLGLTPEIHTLIWTKVSVVQYEYFSALELAHGPWFYVVVGYSYVYLASGTIVILRSIGSLKGLYRGQTVALLISVIAPWVGNALYISKLSPIHPLDLTPFAFTISVVGVAWGIFGFRLVDIAPVARDVVLENMREGMIVLDTRAQVVDMNPAAGRMIGLPAEQAIGKTLDDIFGPWPYFLERFRDSSSGTDVIVVGRGEARRRYSVRVSPLENRQNRVTGRVIMMRDLDETVLPEPRLAVREPDTNPLEEKILGGMVSLPRESSNPFVQAFVNFFLPPVMNNIPVQPGVNPIWTQAMERVLTIMMRVATLIGSVTIVIILPIIPLEMWFYGVSIVLVIGLLWILSFWRTSSIQLRTNLFLALIYGLALVEIFNFGYSVEAFTYFVALAVLGTLFDNFRGGVLALAVSLITLSVFGWLIPNGIYHSIVGAIPPVNLQSALISITTYAAVATALMASVNALVGSLNRAWQKETQALNLLQQERDLLEQRVTERTRDLADARDQAIHSRDELRKYFLAMEQSGNSIVITDVHGRIEYVNPKFLSLTGYSLDDVLGGNPHILKSGQHDADFYKDLWKTILAGKVWRGQLHNRRKDGSLYWELVNIAPVMNETGDITHYVAIKEDITAQKELQDRLREQNDVLLGEIAERKRTEALLQESETRFRQIVESASDIIYRTDASGRFNYVNPTTLRVMGFSSEEEMLGLHFSSLVVPEWRHKLKRFYDRQFLSGEQSTYFECQAITLEGDAIWIGQNVQIIKENGAVIGFQAVARDITRLKQAQDALAISRDQALEASRLKTQLLSRVSHELRTPLSAILGYSELLAINAFGPLNEEQKDASVKILESTEYLTQLVNDLLDQAQAETKNITLRMRPFSPAVLLERVYASMELLARKKGLTFEVELAPELPQSLYGDEGRLQQILINLAGNAVKFTRTGGVKLKIYQSAPMQWAIRISDTGEGIPKEAQSYIFEPFRQLDNAITRQNRGTGLGLSIAKQLVEIMDGSISLESEPGRGSTFTITMPMSRKSD